jgi:hypothetical protein
VAERFAHYVEVEDAGSAAQNSRPMWKMALLALAVLAAVETPQPDNSGRLADRQFAVAAPRGSGIARYFGSTSLDGSDATQAAIVVHGVLRDADYYFDSATRAVAIGHAWHTLVIAPQFIEASDLADHNIPKNTLFWPPTWPGGSDARNAAVSTYDVFDAMLARLSDPRRFPNMRRIVIIGHSAVKSYNAMPLSGTRRNWIDPGVSPCISSSRTHLRTCTLTIGDRLRKRIAPISIAGDTA